MSFRLRFFGAILLPCLFVIGCSGSSGSGVPDSNLGAAATAADDGSGAPAGPLNVSYVPLLVFEAFDDFSGIGLDGVFISDGVDPFVEIFLINPVDATTLDSIDTAVVSDYETTVDDVEISDDESFPVLQKVLGIPTSLRTALVFDVSGSVSSANVDIVALVDEAKSYIAQAKLSADPTIASQEYTVWAFGTRIEELTTDFTANTATLEAALDLVATRFSTNALGATTNLHRAIVQSIGRYQDGTGAYDFRTDGDNDLEDQTTRNLVNLSQLVVFSSGRETYFEMDQALMTRAIQSQSFISYDQASSASDGSVSYHKPVFYYVVGGPTMGETYDPLRDLAEGTTQLLLSAGAYSFGSNLVQKQIDAIDKRIDLSNAYIYSFAFAPRIGSHTQVFTSKSENFNYSLTRSYPDTDFVGDGSPGTPAEVLVSLVEITGPNGEFLSNWTASLSEVSTFAPATRWVNTQYAAGDYMWTLTGGSGTNNADGTYTVSSIAGATATLRLDNTLRVETTTITITN